jgi:hypothetical protein
MASDNSIRRWTFDATPALGHGVDWPGSAAGSRAQEEAVTHERRVR